MTNSLSMKAYNLVVSTDNEQVNQIIIKYIFTIISTMTKSEAV